MNRGAMTSHGTRTQTKSTGDRFGAEHIFHWQSTKRYLAVYATVQIIITER